MAVNLFYDLHSENELGIGNLGDVITKELFLYFGIETIRSNASNAECVGIGSVLQYFLKNYSKNNIINVWGSGFIEDISLNEKSLKFNNNMNFFALRGLLTKQRIEDMYNKKFDNLTLGDPGLLAPLLLKNKIIDKKYDLGIIPHYVDYNNNIFSQIQNTVENSKIINIMGNPIETIKEIAECRNVISTALHGLIVSDSLAIPNKWCEVSDKVYGNGYKFRDYYSVYDIQDMYPLNLNDLNFKNNNLINIVKDSYKINHNNVSKIQDDLISCFPYKNLTQSNKKLKKSNDLLIRLKKSFKKRIAKNKL